MTFFRSAALPTVSFGEVARINVDSGIPIESAPLIENVLEDDSLVKALYDSPELVEWFAEVGVEKLDFGGGEFGITAGMLTNIPPTVLKAVKVGEKALGLTKAKKIIAAMQEAMALEPYY